MDLDPALQVYSVADPGQDPDSDPDPKFNSYLLVWSDTKNDVCRKVLNKLCMSFQFFWIWIWIWRARYMRIRNGPAGYLADAKQ